jgi:hypothetical protein
MKKKLRKIVVDGSVYVWGFSPSIIQAEKCMGDCDVFIAYAGDNHTSPLRIEFHTWEHAIWGRPLRTGFRVIPNDPDSGGINLHQPKWAALLIREGLKQGWQANACSSALKLKNGTELILRLKEIEDNGNTNTDTTRK